MRNISVIDYVTKESAFRMLILEYDSKETKLLSKK